MVDSTVCREAWSAETRATMSTRNRRALIVGAGIAGLAIAVRLRRSDWDVIIVERAPSLRGGGYMIGFGGVGYDAAERLGLLPELRELQPAAVPLVYVDEAGHQRAVMPAEAQRAMLGDRMISLLRGDLEATLHRALDIEVRFGTSVTAITQDPGSVTATLSNGHTETVDLLIGADGLHSSVRAQVFGPEERYRHDFGYGIATCLVDRAPDAIEPGRTVSMESVGRGAGIYALRDGRSAAFFSFASDQLDADLQAGAAPTLRRIFGDVGWVMPELLASVEAADSVYFDRISQIRMDRWTDHRVALLGDSAWCVSLFAGYGSSLAVGGADLLGNLLDDHDIDTALRLWEEQLRPTVVGKQRLGRRASRLFVVPNETVRWLRFLTFRFAGSRFGLALMRRFLGLPKPVLLAEGR